MPLSDADITRIQSAILDSPITRQGAGTSGDISLRTMVAWSDALHIITRERVTEAVGQIVTSAAEQIITATPGVDADSVRAAIEDAAAKVLAGIGERTRAELSDLRIVPAGDGLRDAMGA